MAEEMQSPPEPSQPATSAAAWSPRRFPRGRTTALVAVVVVIIAIIVYVALSDLGYAPQINIIISPTVTTSLNSTTTIRPQGTVATTTIGSGSGYQGCLGSGTEPIQNGNFADGTFAYWNATSGFGTVPLNVTHENSIEGYYSVPWSGYDNVFFASTYTGGLSFSPGNLTSPVFQVTEPYLNFQIVSPENNGLYVEVLKNGMPVIKAYFNTLGSEGSGFSEFKNASIPMASLLCSNVTVRVVADVVGTLTTHYEYMAVGGFYLSQNSINDPTILVNESFPNHG